MSQVSRLVGLPALALVLVSTVVGVQLAQGGGEFEPLQSADPCIAREVTSQAEGIDGLTERLVLLGIDGAACRLGISREALTLELAQPGTRTDAQVDALRAGLLAAVRRMKEDGTLPPASDLVDEAMDNADLNGLLEAAIRALPDSVVDAALKTDDFLTRAIKTSTCATSWRTSTTRAPSTRRWRPRSPRPSRTRWWTGSATCCDVPGDALIARSGHSTTRVGRASVADRLLPRKDRSCSPPRRVADSPSCPRWR